MRGEMRHLAGLVRSNAPPRSNLGRVVLGISIAWFLVCLAAESVLGLLSIIGFVVADCLIKGRVPEHRGKPWKDGECS